jgi:hypothetical protein
VRRARRAAALLLLLAAGFLPAASLLRGQIEEVARSVESVRGRRFGRQVPAAEIEAPALKRLLRGKLAESLPVGPEETFQTLAALGLLEEQSGLLDQLIDFYASQVIAFYDPEPRQFFVVRGAAVAADAEGEALEQRLVLSHELMHALQDEELRLDRRMKDLRDDSDRLLALQCLLEGEATLVMVRIALKEIPGADESAEEMMAPLLSAGALERAGVPKNIPDYFVDQLFFPYVEGTEYVRRAVTRGGWAAVDRLWSNPPRSTAEILHPEAQVSPATGLLPEKPETLAPPGFRFLYSDSLGEWTVRFLLRRSLETESADAIAAGWRGDRIAFFASGRSIAWIWRLRLASAEAAERFESAWKRSGNRRPDAASERLVRSGSDVVATARFPAVPSLPGLPARTLPAAAR